jgi:short-subunit dehydrogenase
VLPHLKKRGGGWIINVSSLAGKNAFPEAAAYCASKSGLNAFSEALMQEVRHDGIRVAYVMPGSSTRINTTLWSSYRVPIGSYHPKMWPKWWSYLPRIRREVCRAA